MPVGSLWIDKKDGKVMEEDTGRTLHLKDAEKRLSEKRIVFFLLGGLKMTEKKMSLIDRCKQIDIVDFARNNGMAVVNKGRDYRLEDHDSFVFDRRKQRFYWNSQNISGDIIELAKLFFIDKEIQDSKTKQNE
nr:hypothetical protein FOCLOMLH_00119 [Enterococcus faecium]